MVHTPGGPWVILFSFLFFYLLIFFIIFLYFLVVGIAEMVFYFNVAIVVGIDVGLL